MAAPVAALVVTGPGVAPAAAAVLPAWTVYHGDPSGSGVDTSGVTFSPPATAWSSPTLDGQVYGEPLEWTGRVFVATENDTVYSLAADSGAVLWSTHLGPPVPSGDLPCGDISPAVGITGTPVVDPARAEIFVVADELVDGAPTHLLVGLDTYTGAVLVDRPVDPPGADTSAILQRTGLALDDGSVVFGFGGNDGDCSTYHGWVMAAPESGGAVGDYQIEPGGSQGAVWMGGAAPEVDSSGNIWVATATDRGLRARPTGATRCWSSRLRSSWSSTSRRRAGATTTAMTWTSDRLRRRCSPTARSSRWASPIPRTCSTNPNLGGVGGQLIQANVCGSDADGGDAVDGTVVYVPCLNGVEAIQTGSAPPGLAERWQPGTPGPPIVAGGLVWSIGGGCPPRHRSDIRSNSRACRSGRGGQPLPDALSRRRPVTGADGRRSRCLQRVGGPPRPADTPTAGAPSLVLLGGGLRRRALLLRQCSVLRLDGRTAAQ